MQTFNTPQASEFLLREFSISHTPSTLEVKRSQGKGPGFIKGKNGRVFYREKDLRAYGNWFFRTKETDHSRLIAATQ